MTEVTLKYGEHTQKFEVEHAQNILALEERLGVKNWTLSDSNFELKDGIIERKNNKSDKAAKERLAVEEGSTSSE